ncbi:histidine--tRNA ligase [Oceanobacillus locisalsi]|uniref:Histidine--tRNA ligase n=1 Tax=Oceanobacillus locisalsi TaxID=546107 RepID=A0ABW3NCW1_9BACI
MAMKAPRGTVDILPEETAKWQYVENKIKEICDAYYYHEIRTPIFEHTEVFQRGVGDSTDIVQKEMYTFEDRGGRSITLRPEGTAAVARSFVENKLFGSPDLPEKLYYFGSMFRYERPQKGRMRQLNQFGVEAMGSEDPAVDAEVIDLAMQIYQSLGLSSLKLVINSLGDKESRQAHRDALVAHFDPHREELCADCQARLDNNPLRVLDCKKDRDHPAMKTAPSILDYLNEKSQTYFEQVKTYLDAMEISYVVDPNLVRGLDYYNHTAFEIMSEADGFGAITTLAGGGRYDGLINEFGGPNTPGIGFGMGLERLLMALKVEGVEIPVDTGLDCYVAGFGSEQVRLETVKLVHKLRSAGIQVDTDYQYRKMKGQLKAADRLGAKFVFFLGDDEVEQQIVTVKNMNTGNQKEIPINDVTNQFKALLEEI